MMNHLHVMQQPKCQGLLDPERVDILLFICPHAFDLPFNYPVYCEL